MQLPTTDTLAKLERRIAELEADLRLIGHTIATLERFVLNTQEGQ